MIHFLPFDLKLHLASISSDVWFKLSLVDKEFANYSISKTGSLRAYNLFNLKYSSTNSNDFNDSNDSNDSLFKMIGEDDVFYVHTSDLCFCLFESDCGLVWAGNRLKTMLKCGSSVKMMKHKNGKMVLAYVNLGKNVHYAKIYRSEKKLFIKFNSNFNFLKVPSISIIDERYFQKRYLVEILIEDNQRLRFLKDLPPASESPNHIPMFVSFGKFFKLQSNKNQEEFFISNDNSFSFDKSNQFKIPIKRRFNGRFVIPSSYKQLIFFEELNNYPSFNFYSRVEFSESGNN